MNAITTDRLTIRNFVPDDSKALHKMILQYVASEYAAYDHAWPTSEEEIRSVAEWFSSGGRFLAVCLKETGGFIGFIALTGPDQSGQQVYSLGYIFDTDCRGHGYATEGCRAILGHAFTALDATKVFSSTAAVNEPSCRLLRRLGMTQVREGVGSLQSTPDGEPIEFRGFTFALSKAEWGLRD